MLKRQAELHRSSKQPIDLDRAGTHRLQAVWSMLLQPRLSASFIPISGVDIIQHRIAMGLGLRSSLWDLQLICFKRHSVGRKTIHSTVCWHPTRPSQGFMRAETRATTWQLAGHGRNDDHESWPSQSKSSCISIVVVLLIEVSMVLPTVLA